MTIFTPEWHVYRGQTYQEGYAFYGSLIKLKGSKNRTEDDVRQHLLDKWYWAYIDWKLKDFIDRPRDPHGELPQLHEDGEIVPDIYYIRAGNLYALIERNVVEHRLDLCVFYRNSERSYWLVRLANETGKPWEVPR